MAGSLIEGLRDGFEGIVEGIRGSEDSEEIVSGEADYGISESTADEIPTRVKPPTKPRSQKSTAPRSSAKFELRIAAIKEGIEEELNDAGIAVGEMGFSTTGYVACDGSEDFANAIVEMARNRPRLLGALEKVSKGAQGSRMGKYIMALVMAVMVDLGTRSPDGFIMDYLGVKQAYDATHPHGEAQPLRVHLAPPPGFG